MAQQYASIEDFTYKHFSIQQTALIDNLLYEDKHMELYNNLYNLQIHTVELSSGTFIGTHQQLMIKKAAILEMLQRAKNKALQKDIELLETNRGVERTIYEWYAVPYWIARYFIDCDEVVLSWKDCYWWGRCITGQSITFDSTIKQLFSTTDKPIS